MLIANRYKTSKNLVLRLGHSTWLGSRLCDITEWEDPEFQLVAKEIMGSDNIAKHRKVWEFAASVLALKELGLLNKNSLGLSVAAGTERILFYLANKIAGIIATDIYGKGDFSYREANLSFLENQKQFSPYPYIEQNLCAAYGNALDLKFSDNSFDFSLCLSSIEHFGGIKAANKALSEMSRVIKPGGYVIITTEISINDYKTDQIFKLSEIKKIIQNTNLTLSSDFGYSQSHLSLNHLCDMKCDDLSKLPHINLKAFASIFTSGLLILKKEGAYHQFDNASEQKEKLWLRAKELNREQNLMPKRPLIETIKMKLLSVLWRIQARLV